MSVTARRYCGVAVLALALSLLGGAACGAPLFEWRFAKDAEGWVGEPAASVARSALPRSGGRPVHGLQAKLAPPGAVTFRVRKKMDWRSAGTLSLDAFVTKGARNVQLLVYVRDRDGLWYQTSRVRRLKAGERNAVSVDVSQTSLAWEPVGHARPWCAYGIQHLDELGVKLFGDRSFRGEAYIANIVVKRAPPGPRRALRLYNFTTSGAVVPQYGLFEVSFEMNRTFDNPFDPDHVSVTALFIDKDGLVHPALGFFYQDFQRRLREKVEILTPRGRPVWKVRYAPRKLGPHRFFVEIALDKGKTRKTFFKRPGGRGYRELRCVRSDNPGYVRVSPKDWRYFEFENGDFFYPIGHNIPATYNVKNAEKLGLAIQKLEGTFAYDRFLDGMKRGEENYARIWLASWSFGLEWSRKYSLHYRGLGRYNLRNAWRLDYVLDRCERQGIYAQLALTTFGHYRTSKFEGDWSYSPYNKINGGPVGSPTQFWTDPACWKYYRRMLRYVGARWGYSTHIMSWEISNEIDLVDDYGRLIQDILQWHKQCVKTLHSDYPPPDQGRHLITTNFAVWQRDRRILDLPEISYSSTNRYARPIISNLRNVYRLKSKHRKPAIMAECGDDHKGSSAQTTETYIPICLWAAYMMPFAGGGTQWWWDFIDDRNLYYLFRPISRFARGEDRRGRDLKMQTASAVALPAEKAAAGLGVECLGNSTGAYFFVYETMLLKPDESWLAEPRKDVGVRLNHLKDGEYEVEFWHTTQGVVLGSARAKSEKGRLVVKAPEFVHHIAAKVRPVKR